MLSQDISHYRIIRKLGQGGMGEVYLADDSVLRRKVAIKLLPPESMGDDQSRRRLLREAQAAATLDHPNICAIYEIDNQEGASFIVMQSLDGETPGTRLRAASLGLKESLDVIGQVASALEEATCPITSSDSFRPSDAARRRVARVSPSMYCMTMKLAPS